MVDFKYHLRFFTQKYDENGEVSDENLVAKFNSNIQPVIPQIDTQVFFEEGISPYRVLDVSVSYPYQDDPNFEDSCYLIDVIVEEEE